MPAPLTRYIYIPSAVKAELKKLPERTVAFFAGPYAAWQRNVPKDIEIDLVKDRVRIGPSRFLTNQRLELVSNKSARTNKGRPGPLISELQRAMLGSDVGFKGYLRVRGVGYRFQLEQAKKSESKPGDATTYLDNIMKNPNGLIPKQATVGQVRGVDAAAHLKAVLAKQNLAETSSSSSSARLYVAAGLSHPLFIDVHPEFKTAVTRKFRMIRFRSKGLNSMTQMMATLRSMRKPDVYKGKGIRYRNDPTITKEGKKKKV